MNALERIVRHARITALNYEELPSPPFLILFINSICNQRCEHCFYWSNLNRKDDLTKEELFALSLSLGRIENLNLSGGEPFLRKEFSEIVRQFIRHNKTRQVYVPTNSYFKDKMIDQITRVLEEPELELFAVEMSLDGLGEFHDKFRGSPNSFKKAMESYDALAKLQEKDQRLRIHAISTATDVNMDEIKRLTTFLFDRCPQMDHHNLAIMRGDPKNHSLSGPSLVAYQELYEYIRGLWATREEGRYGGIVEPMLQHAKVRTIEEKRQVIPCRAGVLSAVVYSNGDVSVCELHEPLGNLRQQTFWEIWNSEKAAARRKSIACKECWCTTEVFMWPSFTYQPQHMVKTILGAKAWEKPVPLDPSKKIAVNLEDAYGKPSADAIKLAEVMAKDAEALANEVAKRNGGAP
ncbi:MAG: radical SAM protein [Planctomycetes bacterium]|nr:radical SAM protein [Planctomycetota bacterium]